MTEKVHGITEREKAEKATQALFPTGGSGALLDLDEATLLELVKEAPSSTFAKAKLGGEGCPIIDVLAEAAKLWPSRGEIKRALPAGSVYLNNVRETDAARKITAKDLLHGKYLVLRKGKKDYHLLRVE